MNPLYKIIYFVEEQGESNLQVDKLTAKNTKLQEQMKEVRAKLKDSDSQLKTARIELIEKEKYRCESEEKCTFFQTQMDDLQVYSLLRASALYNCMLLCTYCVALIL